MAGFVAQAWLETPAPVDGDEGILEEQYTESLATLPPYPPKHDMDKLTVFEILTQLKHTTQLLRHIEQFPQLVAALSNTALSHSIWAPTDAAFLTLSEHHKIPSKELWEEILQHHITPHLMPISRILHTPNIPVLLCPPKLNGDQRLRLRPNLAGIQVNFDAHITEGDIIACNGIVHIVDAVVLPPPSIIRVVSLLPPGDFNVLQLALQKTGLADEIAEGPFKGGTLFAPNNFAFRNLGEATNRFLFSDEGSKYLRALIKYHFIPNQTLYSNAFYKPLNSSAAKPASPEAPPAASSPPAHSTPPLNKVPDHKHRFNKGSKSFELPTYLAEHNLHVDITRFGGLILMRLNNFTPVTVQDGVANNGVVHVVSGVLIPPRGANLVKPDSEEKQVMDLKEFMSRFEGST